MQRCNAFNNGRQGGWNKRVGGIGPISLAGQRVPVDFGVKRFRNLGGGAAELYETPSLSHRIDAEAVGSQPSGNGVDILLGRSKPLAEFTRREPTVIVDGRSIVLLSQKLFQRLLLRLAAGEKQHHPLHRQISGGRSDGRSGTS